MFALKLKYPEELHLLRGSMEDINTNRLYGFAEECALRFKEDVNNIKSVYQTINRVFEHLPLACLVDDKIFCVHAGIG